jgi:release factor glutamine methyltransferase
MASVAELLAEARRHIPPAEARLLLGHLLGRDNSWLEAHREENVTAEIAEKLSALATRRAAGEPIAYLLGVREFYGRDFAVTPDVLIPRPETELLIDIAKEKLFASDAVRILDLGAGSGCIAVTLALELDWVRVVAVDVSPAALAVARGNARRQGAQAQVEFVESDWFAGLPPQRFDLIVANPPYVAEGDPHLTEGDLRFEPRGALTDHADGLSAIRRIVAEAPRWLAPGGWLWVEHGYDQAAAVHALLVSAGFAAIEQRRDLAGIVRVSGGRIPD